MVVVNLYAFEKTAAKPGVPFEELIENIDIGGPSMIRSAAKNFQDVAVVTSPADYDAIAEEMANSGGALSLRRQVASGAKGIRHHCRLRLRDRLHTGASQRRLHLSFMPEDRLSAELCASLSQDDGLRYGENPHQKAAMYSRRLRYRRGQRPPDPGQRTFLQQHRRSAGRLGPGPGVRRTVCAIIKHTNPCGTATGKTLAEAYKKALECDPVSAFGGVIGVNRPVDGAAAEEMAKLFLEVIAAPAFDEAAKAKFAAKKNLRLVEINARHLRNGC